MKTLKLLLIFILSLNLPLLAQNTTKTQNVTKPSESAPFGWENLNNRNIMYSKQREKYNLVCINARPKGNCAKEIASVYVFPKYMNSDNVKNQPPSVRELVYHNLGDDKDFCSVVVGRMLYDKSGNVAGFSTSEIRLNDDDAQFIIDLLANESGFENCTNIKFRETKSEIMEKPKSGGRPISF